MMIRAYMKLNEKMHVYIKSKSRRLKVSAEDIRGWITRRQVDDCVTASEICSADYVE